MIYELMEAGTYLLKAGGEGYVDILEENVRITAGVVNTKNITLVPVG